MWQKLLENRSSKLLERSMDASMLRNRLISHNIANVNTPFYKRLDIDFKSLLADTAPKNELELVVSHPMHFSNAPFVLGALRVERENKTLSRFDQNNVDVEFEMAQVSENSLYFQSVSTSWNKEMSRIKMAIEGRV